MNPAELSLTISPNLTKAQPTLGAGVKNGYSAAPAVGGPVGGRAQYERINTEPMYTALKSALGNHWTEYKATISAFVLGQINQAELSWVIDPLISTNPPITTTAPNSEPKPVSILQLHNQLIVAIYANTLRDQPPSEVAPWVVATDKPASTSKNAGAGSGSNDKADERLRKEVMGLHARDRQRIKSMKEPSWPVNNGFAEMQAYASELGVKSAGAQAGTAQAEPQSATGAGPSGAGASSLARSNFEIEIRRRYAQPLAAEQLEFPGQTDIQNRIEPICYEEGLTGGVQQGALGGCGELVEQATEVFIKEVLGALLGHSRSNAASRDGIHTRKFKKQIRKEEEDAERGILQRSAGGLLPAEMEAMAKRRPLTMQDLRLGVALSDSYLKSDRALQERISLTHYPELNRQPMLNGAAARFGAARSLTNGVIKGNAAPSMGGDAMDVDEPDYTIFKGTGRNDYQSAMGALDDCLAAAG